MMENFINKMPTGSPNESSYDPYSCLKPTEITLPLENKYMTEDMRKYVDDLRRNDNDIAAGQPFDHYLTICMYSDRARHFTITLKTKVRNNSGTELSSKEYTPNLTHQEEDFYIQWASSHFKYIIDLRRYLNTNP